MTAFARDPHRAELHVDECPRAGLINDGDTFGALCTCPDDRPCPCSCHEGPSTSGSDDCCDFASPAAQSTGGAGGAAAAFPTGSQFLQLSDQVLVIPDEVAAVTQHMHHKNDSTVWLRGGTSPVGIHVRRPLGEVANALAEARAHRAPD